MVVKNKRKGLRGNMSKITMGSLFDGSGGFPLVASMCGIEPIYASEIEPFPIRVTTKRFPNMKHYGDVSQLNGAELPIVDIVTGGSPCQDLSVAGKRAGLKHEDNGDDETTRSGLFIEQIRLIKEMREHDRRRNDGKTGDYIRPRFMVWENVPGAFSSNKGEDFRIVLEETARVADKNAVIPRPPKGKWSNAGEIVGDGWSIAWRVFDAQFWGVPQRRRRIYLVADFSGGCAGKVLFKRNSLRGNFTQSEDKRERTSGDIASSLGAADREVYSVDGNSVPAVVHERDVYAVENHPNDSRVKIDETGTVQSLTSRMGTGGGNVPLVMEPSYGTLGCNNDQTVFVPFCKGTRPHSKEEAPSWKNGEVANTLNTFDVGETRCNELIVQVMAFEPGIAKREGGANRFCENCSPTIRAKMGDNQTAVAYKTYQDKVDALCARDYKGVGNQYVCENELIVEPQISDNDICHKRVARGPSAVCAYPEYIVRRLTPLECCRLQGFPDDWTSGLETPNPSEDDIAFWRDVFETHSQIVNGKPSTKTDKQIIKWLKDPYSDSALYKMWGNGICLQNALYVMQGIADVLGGNNNEKI